MIPPAPFRGSEPLSWTLSGLEPGATYDLYEPGRGFRMSVDSDGDGVLVATMAAPSALSLSEVKLSTTRQVCVLLDGVREAGTHEVIFEASNLPSGTYLVRLETPQGSFVQTMQRVK